jgi:hypothetical protein
MNSCENLKNGLLQYVNDFIFNNESEWLTNFKDVALI